MPKRARSASISIREASQSPSTSGSVFDDEELVIEASAKRSRKGKGSTASSSTGSAADKDPRKLARKERNRISAQASRDRKKLEKNSLESRVQLLEERNAQLEKENRSLKDQQAKNSAMESQLDSLKARFAELENMLAGATTVAPKQESPLALPSQQPAATASNDVEGFESTSQGVVSGTHAKVAIAAPVADSSNSYFSPPAILQHQPEILSPKPTKPYSSFTFLDAKDSVPLFEYQDDQSPLTVSSVEEPLFNSNNWEWSALDQTFLLPPTSAEVPSNTAQEGTNSCLLASGLSSTYPQFSTPAVDFSCLQSATPSSTPSVSVNTRLNRSFEDEFLFGFSYEALMKEQSFGIKV